VTKIQPPGDRRLSPAPIDAPRDTLGDVPASDSDSRASPANDPLSPVSPRLLARRKAAHEKLIDLVRERASLDWSQPSAFFQDGLLDKKEAAALRALQLAEAPIIGYGGEMVPQGPDVARYPGSYCVTQYPTLTSASASTDRLGLASDAQCFDAAVDAAHAIAARDSTERMLAHQLAAIHTLSMKMVARAHEEMRLASTHRALEPHTKLLAETARLGAIAARLMDTYQRGLLTINRLRSGNHQTVTVIHQHVHVESGGQAAIAGALQSTEPN
jgi:hypothetical protein